MARKKKNLARRSSTSNNWFNRMGLGHSSSTHSKARNRKLKKYNRAATYWQVHGLETYSKVVLRPIERMWIETNAPLATITFMKVLNAEKYPRYRSGMWDGFAYVVVFANGRDASKFKMALWNYHT